jgi:hypothetical protein
VLSCGVSVRLSEVEQYSLAAKGFATVLEIGNFLNGSLDKRQWIACARLKQLRMDVDVNLGKLMNEAVQQCTVASLAFALAAEENGSAGSYVVSASHPMCGIAP